MRSRSPDVLDDAYRLLSGEDSDERSCEAIPDGACTDVPRNFLLNLGNGSATKLAEQLAGPNLVLPWLLAALGSPVFLIGVLMPLKQAGSLLPQLAVAARIRAAPRRKWYWVAAGLTQALCLLLMAAAALGLPPLAAGIAVAALLALFSIASGIGSVAFQDVMGKTIPRGRRGRLLSARAAVGGTLTLAAGLALHRWLGERGDVHAYAALVLAAALLWALGAVLFAVIEEQPGATRGGRNSLGEALAGVALLREVPGYRRFLLARATLLSVEIAAPFYALHANRLLGDELGTLGLLVVAVGAANVLSSPFWGRFADTSSRRVMIHAGLLGAAAGALALLLGHLPQAWRHPLLYGLVFLLVGIAEAGVRLGRKTYLVDGAPADERPLYVAFSNTLMGAVALGAAALGGIAQLWGVQALVAVLALLGLLGAAAGAYMPEARRLSAAG